MNAVSPITTSSELDHEIMRRLEAASPQLGRRGFLSLTGMAGAGLALGFSMAPKAARAAAGSPWNGRNLMRSPVKSSSASPYVCSSE